MIDPIDAVPSGKGHVNSPIGGASSSVGGTSAVAGESSVVVGGTSSGGRIASGSGGSSGSEPLSPPCTSNADCQSNSRCVSNHTCARLDTGATGPCPKVLGAEFAGDPNAIFWGAFAPLDQSGAEARTISSIYEMAAQEFNDLGGLRGVAGAAPSPLVMIVCNNAPNSVAEALRHLVDVAQVPAVLSAMDPNQLLTGFNKYPHTFFISAFNGSEELANVSNGRAWTMLGQPSDFSDIYQALMPHAEAMVHADLISRGKDRDIRVAVVTEAGNSFEQELANAFLPKLAFNGKKASEQPSNYLGRELLSDSSNVAEVVGDIYAALPPDIVVSFASSAFTVEGGVMNQLNQKYWSGARPVYILSPENAENDKDVTAELTRLTTQVDHKSNTSRVFGVGPAGLTTKTTDAFNTFALRLTSKYPGASPDFSNYYDAFYFLAYATYASPRAAFLDGTIGPSDLARGMRRLTNLGKTSYSIGPNDISDVFTSLNDPNATLELDGTMGRPDFDRTSGMRRESGSIYCFDTTRNEIQKDVISYDRETQELHQVDHPLCLINFLSQ